MVALTIGMATYDDFDGVYFTLQALRLYQDLDDTEIVVVDNYGCDHTRKLVENLARGRYVRATEVVGTAAAKNLVFKHAKGQAVVCCDSHVLFAPGAIARLKAYHEEHPDSIDLLQGPLVYDDMKTISTHFDPVWRGQMWGIWATDPRGIDPDGEPFEIPMQGMGVFSCRRKAWPRFNAAFRGFGGEEGYIHEKIRQRGGKCYCMPWLRWMHRFGRPKGVPYRVSLDDKLRNYVIGYTELGLDLDPVREHYAEFMTPARIEEVIATAIADEHSRQRRPSDWDPSLSSKRRKRKSPSDVAPVVESDPDELADLPFDDDMARAILEAIPDEVRIAYGMNPQAVEGFPPPGPERAAARAESRALLVEQGWLEPEDFAALSATEAAMKALRKATELLRPAFSIPAAPRAANARVAAKTSPAPVGETVSSVLLSTMDGGPLPIFDPSLPLVSCICPTYGRAPDHLHLLEEAIESFLRQTYPNKELIVLNDCPEQELVCDAPGVRVVNVPERFGSLGEKRNAAIALAKGSLIAPWDDDDISLPWRLAVSVERINDVGTFNPGIMWLMDSTGLHPDPARNLGHNLSLFTRDAFEAVGGYLPISFGEDLKLEEAFRAAGIGEAPSPRTLPVSPDEIYYIYRWGVSPRHLSSRHREGVYDEIGRHPVQSGRFVLRPHWRSDYVADVRAMSGLLVVAGQ